MSDRFIAIGLFSAIALVIIVLAIALSSSPSTTSTNNVKVVYYDEPVNSSDTSDTNNEVSNNPYSQLDMQDRKDADRAIKFVSDLLKNAEYDRLYNKLSNEYKNNRFMTKDIFVDYLEEYYPKDKIVYKDYSIELGTLYINFTIDDSIQRTIKVDNYSNGDYEYTIYFGSLRGFNKMVGSYHNSQCDISIISQIDYAKSTSIVMLIKNTTDSTLTYDFSGSYIKSIPNKANNKKYTNSNDNTCEIEGKSSCIYELSFGKMNGSIHYIGIKLTAGEKSYSYEIPVSEDSYI